MEAIFEFIFKISSRNADIRQWLKEKKAVWEWLIDWAKEYKMPPNPIAQNTSMRLFKKRNNMNQMQMHNQLYKMDQLRA